MMTKAHSQPKCLARGGMVSGATSAPMEAPELKTEVAKARSLFGKYSAVTLMAAGKLPASPKASRQRAARKAHIETVEISTAPSPTACSIAVAEPYPVTASVRRPHMAWAQAPALQMTMAQVYPFRVPSQSTSRPANSMKKA